MSPETSDMLMQHIVPAITATVPRTCRPVGSEDYAELVQDTILTAARMLDAAERAGKAVNPSSIVYYAVQTTRSGRRSQSSSGTDALGVLARFSDGSVPVSLYEDDRHDGDKSGKPSLLDLLASNSEDPASAAARRMDWAELEGQLDEREREVLSTLQSGGSQGDLARRLNVSAPRVCQIRDKLRHRIAAFWGETALCDMVAEPRWQYGLRAGRERDAARWERKSEQEKAARQG